MTDDESDVPMIKSEGPIGAAVLGPHPIAFLGCEDSQQSPETAAGEEVSEQDVAEDPTRGCIERLEDAGDDVTTEEMLTAMQRDDELAIHFDLAMNRSLYVTRSDVSEYRALFVTEGGSTAPCTSVVGAESIRFYNEFADASPVRLEETPLPESARVTSTTSQGRET